MNKKIISLILIAIVSSSTLISCGSSKTDQDTSSNTSTESNASSESSSSTESTAATPSGDPAATPSGNASASNKTENKTNNSSVKGENTAPTVEVTQIATIADFKGKDSSAISALLGNPTSENGTTSTYEKDGYTFDITYYDSICGQIKITPKSEMNYAADANNILKVLGINAVDSDTITPLAISWSNKFDTYQISVFPNATSGDKLGYVQVILSEQYK